MFPDRPCSLIAATALAVLAGGLALPSAAVAGKPAPPPPPPMTYQIHYFTGPQGGPVSSIRGMNDNGVMVGETYTSSGTIGWLYDPSSGTGEALDLNELVLAGAGSLPDGWTIVGGNDVNDRGAILVDLEKVGQHDPTQVDYERKSLLIDTRTAPWTCYSLPASAFVSVARRVNNNGDVLGCFVTTSNPFGPSSAYLYNPSNGLSHVLPGVTLLNRSSCALSDPAPGEPLRVAGLLSTGRPFRFRLDTGVLESFTFEADACEAINGFGVFCGRAKVFTKATVYTMLPFRYDKTLTVIGSAKEQAMTAATDINNSDDVILGRWLYRNGTLLNLDNLVVGSTADVSYWKNNARSGLTLTPRDATSFPLIGARAGNRGCLLTPVAQ